MQRRYAYEVHFSLFVFLSDVERLKLRPADRKRAVGLIISSLESVRAARAAWMAGDALGDALCSRSVASALAQVANHAKFAAGRSAAVKALADCLGRTKSRSSSPLWKVIKRAARSDRSKGVRASARLALWRLTCSNRNAQQPSLQLGRSS
jgi:hypothetical protein